jgi:pimeloyl-ACP methyl ester carboxylesterase
MTPEALVTGGPIRVLSLAGAGEVLVLSFASIGHDPQRPPSPEFIGTATDGGRPALFICDESRSWGQAAEFLPALEAAIAAVRMRQHITRIVALGQSMGASMALRAAAHLPIEAVLAFGPQSFLGPDEGRWQPWSARLLRPLEPPAPPRAGQHLVLMHGLADDRAQAHGFAPADGLDHLLFPGRTHSALCPHLRQRGTLKGLLASLIAGDRRRLIRIAASAGGHLRRQEPL